MDGFHIRALSHSLRADGGCLSQTAIFKQSRRLARMIFRLNGLPSRDEGCYRYQVTMFMLILSLRRRITA